MTVSHAHTAYKKHPILLRQHGAHRRSRAVRRDSTHFGTGGFVFGLIAAAMIGLAAIPYVSLL